MDKALVTIRPFTKVKRLLVYWILPWSLEKAMAPHSSTLAWKIPWTKESGRLQSMRLQSMRSLRVGHD